MTDAFAKLKREGKKSIEGRLKSDVQTAFIVWGE